MIEWEHINHFKPEDFPEDPEQHAEPRLIEALDAWRDIVGCAVYPSPDPGALARFEGDADSRHYAVGRLSDAIDVFVDCPIREAWMAAMRSKIWGGVGVYFDTVYSGKPWSMLHLDMRPGATVYWYRIDHRYGHPMKSAADLHRLFGLLANA